MKTSIKGFSLIELIIVIAISSILLASLATVFVSQTKTYGIYSDIGQTQQVGKAVLDFLGREIRMAGSGLVDRAYKINSTSTHTYAHISSINSSTGPDRIRLRGNFASVFGILSSSTGGPDAGAESFKVTYKETGKLQKANFITIYDSNISEIRYVTAVDSSQNKVDVLTGLSHEHAASVFFNGIQDITYSVDASTDFPGTNELKRDNQASSAQPVLPYVEELQFQYGLDTNSDGYVDTWANDVNGKLTQLKEVKMWLLVRSSVADPNFTDTKTYVMGDRSYQPPAGANKYRRLLFTTTVSMRNINTES